VEAFPVRRVITPADFADADAWMESRTAPSLHREWGTIRVLAVNGEYYLEDRDGFPRGLYARAGKELDEAQVQMNNECRGLDGSRSSARSSRMTGSRSGGRGTPWWKRLNPQADPESRRPSIASRNARPRRAVRGARRAEQPSGFTLSPGTT
jgi:hypothetical protein